MLMQDLWKDKVLWDEVSKEIYGAWERFKSQLNALKTIKIP